MSKLFHIFTRFNLVDCIEKVRTKKFIKATLNLNDKNEKK